MSAKVVTVIYQDAKIKCLENWLIAGDKPQPGSMSAPKNLFPPFLSFGQSPGGRKHLRCIS